MKKIILFIAIFALSMVIVACGMNKKINNQPQDTPAVEDTNTGENNEANGTNGTTSTDKNTEMNTNGNVGNRDELSKMDELDYKEFSLDVEYGNQTEYEVDLERNKDNTIEAEIDDKISGVKKTGTEAFNELYPLVKKLTISQETTKEDAIKEVLDVFNLKDDYTKIEIEITFKNGTKIEHEDRK